MSDPSDDPRVLEIARDYLADLEAGRTPDRKAYLARHPELAEAVADCLAGVSLAHAAGVGLRPAVVAVAPPAEPLGDFRIIREIGRGGMGVVYEAVQMSLGRRVALKVLPFAAALDGRQLKRFQTEAQAAAQLHHPHIVPVYAVGTDRGTHYYAMQLIDGRPLDGVIRDFRGEKATPAGNETVDYRLGPTDAADAPPVGVSTRAARNRDAYRSAALLAADVADALDYAHDSGVVHRDIKPANLLVDARGVVWVTDFGLAQITAAEAGLTRTGDVLGTLRYMSPEQAAGRRLAVDHRADVYSLGATLYELLTLEPVAVGDDRAAVLHQVLHVDPRPPRRIDRGIPAELETIVLKAVAKAPEERYATAGAMAADLRRFLDDRPILARRPPALDRCRKWLRRHPAYLGSAVVVLVLGVIGLAASTAVVSRERNAAETARDRERQRAAEAEQRFTLARRSADELIRIADEELSDDPDYLSPRRRLLQAAREFYEELIALRANDPDAQVELAATRTRVEGILADLAVIRGGLRHMLLRRHDVQADLALSADQQTRLEPLFAELNGPNLKPMHRGRQPGSRVKSHELVEQMRAHDDQIAAVLSAAQQRRLGEIALQDRGVDALREPDMVAALGLTAEQRNQLREIDPGPPGSRRGGPPRGPGGSFDGGPPDRRGGPPFRGPGPRPGSGPPADAMNRALAVLTPEQTARWREMTGKPFTGEPRPPGPAGDDRPPPPPPFGDNR